ncbi:MAG: DUF91 domain-containing protein, partial [Actinomycetales bacterium]|nr:DUF91 domain-containing protein [Actinomycetales bacterium]
AFDALYRDCHPGASKVGLGLARTATWLIVQGLAEGDIVLSPDGPGSSTYLIGHVTAPYQYASGQFLPHRRPVSWSPQRIDKQQLSDELRTALKFGGPVLDLNAYSAELVSLPPVRSEYEPEGEALHVIERHLEDFLVTNWASTPFGATHKLMEVDGAVVGQQFRTSSGPIDILAVSHDGAELLVVELKRGRASDRVVGQVLRYMGCVTKDLAEENQRVRGAIIVLEDDPRIRMALAMVPDVDFYRYSIHFSMTKAKQSEYQHKDTQKPTRRGDSNVRRLDEVAQGTVRGGARGTRSDRLRRTAEAARLGPPQSSQARRQYPGRTRGPRVAGSTRRASGRPGSPDPGPGNRRRSPAMARSRARHVPTASRPSG